MVRSSWVVLLALVSSACPAPPQDPDGGAPTEALATRCFNRVPIARAVGPDDAFLILTDAPPSAGPLLLGSSPEGTARAIPFVDSFADAGVLRDLVATSDITWVSSRFQAQRGFVRSQADRDTFGNGRVMVLIIDGRARATEAQGGSALPGPGLPRGDRPKFFWREGPFFIAQDGFWLWASEDGAQTWARVGTVDVWHESSAVSLSVLDVRGDDVLARDLNDNGLTDSFRQTYWLYRAGQEPLPIDVTKATRRDQGLLDPQLDTMRFWGDRLVFFNLHEFWVSSDDGATWTALANDAPSESALFSSVTTSDGALLVYPVSSKRPGSPVLYRYAPGATQPTRLSLAITGPTLESVPWLEARADGGLRFAARVTPNRNTYSTMLCVTSAEAALETTEVGTREQAVEEQRVVRVARLAERPGLGNTERLALTPEGLVYAQAGSRPSIAFAARLLVEPPDAPALFDALDRESPSIGPEALNPLATALAVNGLGSNQGLFRFAIDRGTGQATRQAVDGGAGLEAVQQVRTVAGRTFVKVGGAWRLEGALSVSWPGPLALAGPAGAWVSHAAAPTAELYEFEESFVRRFVPWAEPMPTQGPCGADAGPACVVAPKTRFSATEFDLEGALYALDQLGGRLLRLRPGASTFEEVATGFIRPMDLLLSSVGEVPIAYVLDGDAFVVPLNAARTLQRAEAVGQRVDAFGARDLRGCLEAGPCFDEPQVDLSASLSVCLAGRRLGATAPMVTFGGAPVAVRSWADTQACLDFPATSRTGLLRLTRVDGLPSNTVSVRGRAAVTRGWSVPAVVTPDAVVMAAGTSLRLPPNALVAFGDRYAAWGLPPGPQTLTLAGSAQPVLVQARIHAGCRAPRRSPCTLVGMGFGAQPGTVRIGGESANVLAWSNTTVSVAWPAGAVPGALAVEVTSNGSTVSSMVELLDAGEDVRTLQFDGLAIGGLARSIGPPVDASGGLVVPLARWQGAFVGGVFVPQQGVLAVSLADAPSAQPPGQLPVAPSAQVGAVIDRGLQVTERGGQLWVAQMVEASNAARLRVSVRAFEVVDGGLVPRSTWLGPEEPSTSAVAALGEVDAEPVVAVTRAGTPPTLHRLSTDGGLGAGVSLGTRDTAWVSSRLRQGGVYLAGDGVFTASCGDLEQAAYVGRWAADAGTRVLVDDPAGRLEACGETPSGLLWVRASDAGVLLERGTASGVDSVAVLPASLPGLGQRFSYASDTHGAVLDLAEAGSDVLVLLAVHEGEGGLWLARWHAGSGQWSAKQVLGGRRTPAVAERCVGPSLSPSSCAGWGLHGCAPFACAVRPPDLVVDPRAQVTQGHLTVRGPDAHVTFETVSPATRGTTASVHALWVPVPP